MKKVIWLSFVGLFFSCAHADPAADVDSLRENINELITTQRSILQKLGAISDQLTITNDTLHANQVSETNNKAPRTSLDAIGDYLVPGQMGKQATIASDLGIDQEEIVEVKAEEKSADQKNTDEQGKEATPTVETKEATIDPTFIEKTNVLDHEIKAIEQQISDALSDGYVTFKTAGAQASIQKMKKSVQYLMTQENVRNNNERTTALEALNSRLVACEEGIRKILDNEQKAAANKDKKSTKAKPTRGGKQNKKAKK